MTPLLVVISVWLALNLGAVLAAWLLAVMKERTRRPRGSEGFAAVVPMRHGPVRAQAQLGRRRSA
jgi:hypothetical protein